MHKKAAFQSLPKCFIAPLTAEGDALLREGWLITKETEDGSHQRPMIFATWRTRHQGKGLGWFRKQLTSGEIHWFD